MKGKSTNLNCSVRLALEKQRPQNLTLQVKVIVLNANWSIKTNTPIVLKGQTCWFHLKAKHCCWDSFHLLVPPPQLPSWAIRFPKRPARSSVTIVDKVVITPLNRLSTSARLPLRSTKSLLVIFSISPAAIAFWYVISIPSFVFFSPNKWFQVFTQIIRSSSFFSNFEISTDFSTCCGTFTFHFCSPE